MISSIQSTIVIVPRKKSRPQRSKSGGERGSRVCFLLPSAGGWRRRHPGGDMRWYMHLPSVLIDRGRSIVVQLPPPTERERTNKKEPTRQNTSQCDTRIGLAHISVFASFSRVTSTIDFVLSSKMIPNRPHQPVGKAQERTPFTLA